MAGLALLTQLGHPNCSSPRSVHTKGLHDPIKVIAIIPTNLDLKIIQLLVLKVAYAISPGILGSMKILFFKNTKHINLFMC